MPAPNPVIMVIREWLAKADNDLLTAVETPAQSSASPQEEMSATVSIREEKSCQDPFCLD